MGKAEYGEKITGTTKSFFWNMAWMLQSFAAAQQAGIAKPVVLEMKSSNSELSMKNGHAVLWLTEISAKSKSAFRNLYRLTA